MEYPRLPSTLWHYTSVEGFTGIVDSRSIWGTATSALNDRYEILFGLRAAELACLHRLDSDGQEEPTATILKHIRGEDHSDLLERMLDSVAVSSFTAIRDGIHQWQAYGADASGVAIGFDSAILARLGQPGGLFYPEFTLHGVRYGESESQDLTDRQLAWCVRQFARAYEAGTSFDDARGTSAALFMSVLASSKQEGWRAEAEWRLYSLVLDQVHWQGLGSKSPHVVHKLWDGPEDCPVVEVVTGSRSDPDSCELVRRMLASVGLDHVVVRRSELGY